MKHTQEEVKQLIIANHGDIYNLDKVIYKNNITPIIVGCKKHGCEFSVIAITLLRRTLKNGGKKKVPIVGSCPECRVEYFAEIKKEMFEKFKKAHNNEYEYDEDSYVNGRKPFYAICKIHGRFKITADAHLNGGDKCPSCYPKYNKSPRHKIVDDQNYYVCDIHGDVPIGKNRKVSSGCPICNKLKTKKFIVELSKTSILKKFSQYDFAFNGDNVIISCKKHGVVYNGAITTVNKKYDTCKHICTACRKDAIDENTIQQKKTAEKAKSDGIKRIKKIIQNEYSVQYDFIEFIDCSETFDNCKVRLYNKLADKEKVVFAQSIKLKALSKNHRFILRNYLSFEDAKKRVKDLGIKTLREYQKWHKRTQQTEMPSNPYRFYKEFTTYCDFFDTDAKSFMSHGEKRIENYLIRKNIEYVYQKRFDDCRDKMTLPFDFYLPAYNTIIEFDGLQHFKLTEKFGGADALETTKKHDRIKNQYCKNKGINLIRVRFDDLDDNAVEWSIDVELSRIKAEIAAAELSKR